MNFREQIKIPSDRKVWDGEMATYWFEGTVLISLSKSTLRTVESIGRNVALVKEITENKKVPLLIYLADSAIPDKATRKFSSEQVPQIYSAMAMVSKPGLSRLIMNMVFGLSRPPIPMKSFTKTQEAIQWLNQLNFKNKTR